MKSLKIAAENEAAIDKALEEVNGKARRHTFTTFAQIEAITQAAEQQLDELHLSKNKRAGAVVEATSGQHLPKSYGHTADATRVVLRRGSDVWFLEKIERCALYSGSEGRSRLKITKKQADAALESILRVGNISVIEPPPSAVAT